MKNTWWEIQILCDPTQEDSIFWRFAEFGSRGTASEIQGTLCAVKGYVPKYQIDLADLETLSHCLQEDAVSLGLSAPSLSWQFIDEQDWSNSWKQHWQPQKIGDRFLVNPAWLPSPSDSDRLVITLDPGVAFGTGSHATTQLCLQSLERHLMPSNNSHTTPGIIADIGCGSGILSIGALLLGSAQVYAVDTDPLAVESTISNAALNHINLDNLKVGEGSVNILTKKIDNPVDGIVCNILAHVIIDLLPEISPITKADTWGIFSGILIKQSSEVAQALQQNGWQVTNLWKSQEWCCLNARRY